MCRFALRIGSHVALSQQLLSFLVIFSIPGVLVLGLIRT